MLVIPYFTFSTWHWHPHVLSKIFWLSNWCGYIFFFCTVRFVTASRQLAKNLEHHTLNEHGLSKRYVRCLQVVWIPPVSFYSSSTYICMQHLMVVCTCQISEVVNHMKDLIEFSHKNNLGPKGMMIVHIYLIVSPIFI
jgi:hypothetical protein